MPPQPRPPRRSLSVSRAFCLLAVTIGALVGAPGEAVAERQVPVGLSGLANNPIMASHDMLAVRFVLDEPTTMYRFITGFNMEGVYTGQGAGAAPVEIRTTTRNKGGSFPPAPSNLPAGWTPGEGRIGYSHGDGGTIHARLVAVKPSGEPDMTSVLGQETVNAVQRYRQSKQAYGVTGKERTALLYFNLDGARLQRGVPYAVVFTNAHPDAARNYFSTDMPTAKVSVAGPNGRNTTDPTTPGAVAGLDPRESIAWSRDAGRTWVWGPRVGGVGSGPEFFGYYTGSLTSDEGTKVPWYGWQEAPSRTPRSNQPYYAYGEAGSYTLRARSAPRRVTLTEAGGYAPVGEAVGMVTVRNTTTGATGRTGRLGGGMAKGALDHAVTVQPGQSYEISNSGMVNKAEADDFIVSTFNVGNGEWPFETDGHGYDRAELFALPHPWSSRGHVRPVRRPRRRGRSVILRGRRLATVSASRRAVRVRVRVRGYIARSRRARVRARVRIQQFRRGRWRTLARVQVRRGRFRKRIGVRVSRSAGVVRIRAVVPGAGRSRTLRIRVP